MKGKAEGAPPTPRAPRRASRPAPPVANAPGRALMVIDHERLQSAAWAEFHTARKRLEKATRDLHRHEEIDMPAHESWLHRTFPLLVTELRELGAAVAAKKRKIQAVHWLSARTGRSIKRLWHEQKEREANPEAFADEDEFEEEDEEPKRDGEARREDFEPDHPPRPGADAPPAARDIYRRLVQRLHPDRGGDWTDAREHLWHEVQQAWTAGDVDWLSRLESEWETANEVLGAASPLSSLRRGIEELHAARRDTERKLSEYRGSPQWRFTLTEKKRDALYRRTTEIFEHDLGFLRRQLTHINTTIAAWEEDWTRPDSRPKPTGPRRANFRRGRRWEYPKP